MARGLALPPADAATQHNATPDETDDFNQFLRENGLLDMSFDNSAMNANQQPGQEFFDDLDNIIFGPYSQAQDVMPAAKEMQPPMPAQMPPQMPQSAVPDLSIGPSWNPVIGWYYPVANPGTYTPPQPPPMQYAAPQEGYTPALSTAATSVQPSRVNTPDDFFKPRGKVDRKRKYGPAAYLDQQAKKTTTQGERAVSVSEAEFTSKAKQRDERALGIVGGAKKHSRSKRTQPSIVQNCVCSDKQAQKVKRPKNAFILYRSANAQRIKKQMNTKYNQDVSHEAAARWSKETPAVKARFQKLAQQEKDRHAQMYPDYSYQPGLAMRNRFGSASCTCGAYQANVAANGDMLDTDSNQDSGFETDFELEKFDEYLPPRSQRQQQQAAPALMTNSAYPLPDVSTFGFATPAQQAEATAYVENLKRKRDDDNVYSDLFTDDPIASRLRAPRSTNINYAEPDEDDIFQSTEDDSLDVEPPRKKQRPSPLNFTDNTSQYVDELDKTPSPVAFAVEGPPAQNTRSRSRSRSKSVSFSEFYQYGTYEEDIDWDAFMSQTADTGNVDDDTIVVASAAPRPSSSSKKSPNRRSPRSATGKSSSPTDKSHSLRRSARLSPTKAFSPTMGL